MSQELILTENLLVDADREIKSLRQDFSNSHRKIRELERKNRSLTILSSITGAIAAACFYLLLRR